MSDVARIDAEVTRLRLVTRRYRPVPGKMRAAVCARVSTERQVHGSGLSRQLDICREWAERTGMSVVSEHYGWESAFTNDINKRPMLRRLLGEAELGLVDFVVFENTDRVVRSLHVWREFRDAIRHHGADVLIARHGEDEEELRLILEAMRSA